MRRDEKGLTLIEMMISLAVSTVIAYTIFVAMRVTLNSFDTGNVKMNLQASGREGIYRMVQEIRESAPSKITIGSGGSSITFYVPNPSSPVTSSYAVNWGDQIQYALGSGSNAANIIRTDLTTNTTKVIARDVTSVTFTANATPVSVVTVAMNVQRSLGNGRSIPATPLQISGKAQIRNS